MLQDQSRNRTPMPGAQAPEPTPPDTGPARAEAGIATMLAATAPGPDHVPQAPSDLADACDWVIRHVAWMNRTGGSEDWSDVRLDAEMDKSNAVWKRAIAEPTADLGCVAAKSRMLLSELKAENVDFPEIGQDDRDRLVIAVLRDVAALSPPAASPTELPAPGSPEALAAFSAACRAVDVSAGTEAECAALKIGGSTLQYWTSDVVEQAQMGNFSKVQPGALDAAKATSKERLEELLILALRRELRMAEAAKSSRIRELHALVYGDEPDPNGEGENEATGAEAAEMDQAIEAHRAASAAFTAICPAIDENRIRQEGGDTSKEAMARAHAAWEAADADEKQAWDSLLKVRPTTPGGLLQMLRYVGSATVGLESVADAREFGRDLAEAAESALYGHSAAVSTVAEPDPVSRSIHEARAALARAVAVYAAHRGQEPDSDLPAAYHEAFNLTMDAFRHRVLPTHPTTDAGRQAVARLALDISTKLELDFEPNEANAILACIAGSGPAPALPEMPSGGMAALLREPEECNRRHLALPLTDEAEAETPAAQRDLSIQAFNYAYGLDLSGVTFANLQRLYELFSNGYDMLSAGECDGTFNTAPPGHFRVSSLGGLILDAEVNRMGCLRDAMAQQLKSRVPADESQRDARLKVLVTQEMNCEGTIYDKALLAEVVAAWGAK